MFTSSNETRSAGTYLIKNRSFDILLFIGCIFFQLNTEIRLINFRSLRSLFNALLSMLISIGMIYFKRVQRFNGAFKITQMFRTSCVFELIDQNPINYSKYLI